MGWKKIFEDSDEKEEIIFKVLDLFNDELGKDWDSGVVLSITIKLLMHTCSAVGMTNEDFASLLDSIQDEYVGW